jgi:uncharacterized protein YqjF (DUF2071 family)
MPACESKTAMQKTMPNGREARYSETSMPAIFPVMLQRWHEISFLHWSCDPTLLKPLLPAGLEVDTFEGKGWISLTPFLLTGLRPPLLPHWLGLAFPETNLRTYVAGAPGSGIWFFSLDAARLAAVLGARLSYGLPYYWSRMRVEIGETGNAYFSSRGPRARTQIRIAKAGPINVQSPLDIFLTARFRLYSILRGRLITAEVSHPPWELNQARVVELDESVRRAAGVEFPGSDFLAHHSHGVDTKIGIPRHV